MALLVERPALDFGLGPDLVVCGFKSHFKLHADSAEPVWDSLPLQIIKKKQTNKQTNKQTKKKPKKTQKTKKFVNSHFIKKNFTKAYM